jgi:hypothetical protein
LATFSTKIEKKSGQGANLISKNHRSIIAGMNARSQGAKNFWAEKIGWSKQGSNTLDDQLKLGPAESVDLETFSGANNWRKGLLT